MTLLQMQSVDKTYWVKEGRGKRELNALKGFSVEVSAGETVGLVGESGSGKSTAAKLAVRLEQPSNGKILWQGQDVTSMGERALRPLRAQIQMVFQDPFSSLNPRMKIGTALREPLQVHRIGSSADQIKACEEMIERVGLRSSDLTKYPHEFSGGQRQRVCIARALMLNPQLVIADEAVSALDVSIQAQILALLRDLREQLGLAYLFITHDLEVIRLIADRIVVLEHGQIVEQGTTEQIFTQPEHAYTQRLLSSRPSAVVEQSRTQTNG